MLLWMVGGSIAVLLAVLVTMSSVGDRSTASVPGDLAPLPPVDEPQRGSRPSQTPAATAEAEEPAPPAAFVPSYSPESYCESVSLAVGGSYTIKAACLRQERDAREWIRQAGGISPRTANYCDGVGAAVGGSYSIYQSCVRQESEAASGI